MWSRNTTFGVHSAWLYLTPPLSILGNHLELWWGLIKNVNLQRPPSTTIHKLPCPGQNTTTIVMDQELGANTSLSSPNIEYFFVRNLMNYYDTLKSKFVNGTDEIIQVGQGGETICGFSTTWQELCASIRWHELCISVSRHDNSHWMNLNKNSQLQQCSLQFMSHPCNSGLQTHTRCKEEAKVS